MLLFFVLFPSTHFHYLVTLPFPILNRKKVHTHHCVNTSLSLFFLLLDSQCDGWCSSFLLSGAGSSPFFFLGGASLVYWNEWRRRAKFCFAGVRSPLFLKKSVLFPPKSFSRLSCVISKQVKRGAAALRCANGLWSWLLRRYSCFFSFALFRCFWSVQFAYIYTYRHMYINAV